MTEKKFEPNEMAAQFEANRPRLRGIAYRMLGSHAEAEDVVQEAWLRLSRTDAESVGNLGAWLTTVTARICLDMLRSRRSRREDGLEDFVEPKAVETPLTPVAPADPEHEALLADNVGIALLVVLETLQPAERVAFVLHDMFDMAFDDIAAVVGRSTDATRQLASRARRRVRGADAPTEADRERKREVVSAFLTAARGGDFTALLATLDPDVVFRADAVAARAGGHQELAGADAVARFFNGKAQAGRAALVDGEVGVVVVPAGAIVLALRVVIAGGRIVSLEAIAEPDTLAEMELSVLD